MTGRIVRVGAPQRVSMFGFLSSLIRHPFGVYLHIDGYVADGKIITVNPVFAGKHRPPVAYVSAAAFLGGHGTEDQDDGK